MTDSPTSKTSNDPKPSDDRNGCFLDGMWCCKVCDGEIQDGHTKNCDIWKLEKKHREFIAKEYSAVLTERDRLRAALEQAQRYLSGEFYAEALGILEDALINKPADETNWQCPNCGSRELLTSPWGECRCGWNGMTGAPEKASEPPSVVAITYRCQHGVSSTPCPRCYGSKRAYYETHDAPHCPTCDCGEARVATTTNLPKGFQALISCAGCGVQDRPGARHWSGCPIAAGELVRPAKASEPDDWCHEHGYREHKHGSPACERAEAKASDPVAHSKSQQKRLDAMRAAEKTAHAGSNPAPVLTEQGKPAAVGGTGELHAPSAQLPENGNGQR